MGWPRSASSGLTGRLRAATQAERRLEECAKLGLPQRRSSQRARRAPDGLALVEADDALARRSDGPRSR